MKIIKHMQNLPGTNSKIIPKIFHPLNVEVFKDKSKASKQQKSRVQGYFTFPEQIGINGFIYHLAGGKIGKLQGAEKLDLIESFDEEFQKFQKAYKSIYSQVNRLNQQKNLNLQKEFSKRYLFRKGITFENYIQKGQQKVDDEGQNIAIAFIKTQAKWVLAVLKRSEAQIEKKSIPNDPLLIKQSKRDRSRSIILFIALLIVLGFFTNIIKSGLGVIEYIKGPLYYCSQIESLFK